MSIKNPEVERLATEVAALTGESKTEAIRKALAERRERLALQIPRVERHDQITEFLRREVWSALPPHELGRRLTREEEDTILGYGDEGV